MVQTRSRAKAASLSHEERTAAEPRDEGLYSVTIETVAPVNNRIKTFKFALGEQDTFNFQPGQWLDVHVPGIEKAGGFTLTSTPSQARTRPDDPEHKPFLELAVQKSPDNPPAAWLWQSPEEIIGKEVKVRVGGSFVWPPPSIDYATIKRAVFIAGGVGINPLVSMLSHINEQEVEPEVRILYSSKVPSSDTQPEEVLFLTRLLDLFRKPRTHSTKNCIELFLTGTWDGAPLNRRNDEPIHPLMSLTLPQIQSDTEVPVTAWTHRIDDTALASAVGNADEAQGTVFYVCGPTEMTDTIVDWLQKQRHVDAERVFCEKWW
ncbi:NADH-cytochrome b-5 reductase [Paraphaeosphaeria minitans]|uniref:NADH-cytochrome b-5 reductase n=1 Tax=Paraphaeosphaeria minitans TaxID=565426 RepID=A0A9P6GHN4_9PLEO|nr:NADH-cytochrome b-5 reductase [Paraphaeosphaeria minitans]